jgi:uncharacterized protein YdhG (YjbR/CyaY superfamily)
MSNVKTIDAYIKGLPKEDIAIAKAIRAFIHTLGKYEETISYGMPSFKYKTKIVACFRIYKHHLGFYPYSGDIIKLFSKELKDYKTSTGAVQFLKDKPLPKVLIKKLVKAREKEINLKLKLSK